MTIVNDKYNNKVQRFFLEKLNTTVPRLIQSKKIKDCEIYVKCTSKNLIKLVDILKNKSNCQFNQLIDIAVIDKPNKNLRFQVTYLFLSVKFNTRLYLITKTSETRQLSSLTGLFKSAGWLEREVWDLYGIFFSNHPDLRRILTDYGFLGHPLRKDFPLFGFKEVFFDESRKKITYYPIKTDQNFRSFNFANFWVK